MSAQTTTDVSLIKDEDVLRKMWADTDDFCKKKEIRTHMYKLREARLKEFYNSGEVAEIKTTTTTKSKSDSRTHADSLADHSFLSLKSKEVRDSESPTRDITFKVSDGSKGWNIVTSNETSSDGKLQTSTRIASTEGTQKFDKGKIDYQAKNEQKASVYRDGDDKNYTQSVGAQSSSVIKQEAVGGDENSSFKTSSTKTSSSSRVVTESRSTSEDVSNQLGSSTSRQISNREITEDIRNHPNYIEGKTKVYRETKTLPDGTTVTTTRYETRGGTQSTSQTQSQKVSSTQKQSSTSTTNQSSYSIQSSQEAPQVKQIEYYVEKIPQVDTTVTKKQIINKTDEVQSGKQVLIKNVQETDQVDLVPADQQTFRTVKTKTIINKLEPVQVQVNTSKIQSSTDIKQESSDQFISNERRHEIDTKVTKVDRSVAKDDLKKEKVERRQPIKPGKSELDQKTQATGGQYDSTYRAEFTPKKISQEVSPTHDAFARSLRAVSPDRYSHRDRSVRTSTSSLRSSTSPEKNRHPSRFSPERGSKSPDKYTSSETITYSNRSPKASPPRSFNVVTVSRSGKSPERTVETIHSSTTRRRVEENVDTVSNRRTDVKRSPSPSKNVTTTIRREVNSDTLTRKKPGKSHRSPSPTSTISENEYIRRCNDIVTDLDETLDKATTTVSSTTTSRYSTKSSETRTREERPSSLEITVKKTKKITDRSPTSPLTDSGPRSPTKEFPRRSSLRSPSKEFSPDKSKSSPVSEKVLPKDRPLKRTDTYEERCRQILGISNEVTERRRGSVEKIKTSRLIEKVKPIRKSPERKSPPKKVISETRKSPKKEVDDFVEKKRPETAPSCISEFPSQVRKSPEKQPLEKRASKDVSEFPSQIRRSPEKEPLEPYPEKRRPSKDAPSISEFPSQIRRSPEREPLEPYPEKRRPSKDARSISEFPSQIRRSPEREPLEPYPEKRRPSKDFPSISEFPSQIRRSPEREPLEPYPEKRKPSKESPSISEFPSQIRRSPEKEPLEPYPEKRRPSKDSPSISEFPSQIRRSPEREPLEPYPEKRRPSKESPSISEFPSQIRRSPEREPLELYPEKRRPSKDSPSISEFPSQIRKSPEREPLEPYPEKRRPSKESPSISEFPSQIRRSPEREPLEPYPEKRRPSKESPSISEFPSQIRRSPEREPLEPYPEKKRPSKDSPSISEFPSQIRRSPERESLEPYPEKKRPSKDSPSISEFPSQIRKSPEKEPLEPYPEKQKPSKTAPSVSEFPSQSRKSPSPSRRSPERVTFSIQPTEHSPIKEPVVSEPKKSPSSKKSSPTSEKPRVSSLKKPKKQPSSSESDTDTEINEIYEITTITNLETKKPIQEPTVTKKFVSQLCREDEVKKTEKKKQTKRLIEQESISNKTNRSKITTTNEVTKKLLTNERAKPKDTIKEKPTPKKPTTPSKTVSVTCTRKEIPVTQKTDKKITTTYKTSKFVGVTEYTDEFGKTKPVQKTKPITKKNEKVTLWDIENMNNNTEDKSVHIRTHRIDTLKSPTKTPKPLSKPNSKQDLIDRKVVTTKIELTEPKSKKKPETKPGFDKVKKTTKIETTKKQKVVENGDLPESDDEKPVTVQNIDVKKKKTDIFANRTQSDTNIVKGFKRPEKCISTKSITINKDTEEREVVVDLIRSISSREPTPDRTCALPILSDEEDSGSPRYPDQVTEPDDTDRRRPKKLSDMPILESEDDFARIIDITDNKKITEVDRVEETDDSLLTVNKKINIFLETADKLKKQPSSKKPAPKVERPSFTVTEDLESDECLLSVTDKVSKFISTAEQLVAPQVPDRPKSPICRNYSDTTVTKKVNLFSKTPQEPNYFSKPVTRPDRPEQVDESLKNDECLLSVSDKVSKFISTAEKLTEVKKPVSLSKLDEKKPKNETPTSPTRKSPSRPSSGTASPKRSSPEKDFTTPDRKPSDCSITTTTVKYTRRDSSPDTPRTSRPSLEEKQILSSTIRQRNTETIKKARALFESPATVREISRQKDIINRPSVFEGRKIKETSATETKSKETCKKDLVSKEIREKSKSPERIPQKEREASPFDDTIPGYMKPLDRSLRPNSPHLDNIVKKNEKVENEVEEYKPTKFGVLLKRTDSGKAFSTTTTTTTRKSSLSIEKRVTEEEIDEIFEIEILEDLLEKVVGYDLRKKIRAQIRLVKKLISENRLSEYITEFYKNKRSSPQREVRMEKKPQSKQPSKTPERKLSSDKHKFIESYKETEYQSSYKRDSIGSKRSASPEKPREKSPEKSLIIETKTRETKTRSETKSKTMRITPERISSSVTKIESLRKVSPTRKGSAKADDKPDWVKQRNLRKITETQPPIRMVNSTSSIRTTSAKTTRASSPLKESKTTDVVTSSYGIGPTDENGSPLFGLKALRAQNKTEKSKVQGTVIRSQFYSENGEEPVGQISYTKYSTDPKDLGCEGDAINNNGVTSITTTQKFGYKNTPSLKSCSDKKKSILGTEHITNKTSTFNRRGSVKAISQKFIENAVETLKSEKQTSYPKAGLILRSSSFKESTSPDSREGPPSEEDVVTERKTTKLSSGGNSFLTSSSKVSGVQEVISRMKVEEVRDGDTEEDVEARNLLNKFLGSQVILSGIESHSQSRSSHSSISLPSTVKRTTKVTSTITERGQPVTRTRIFQRPVSEQDLQTVWDEATLNLLLEQSEDYEERRLIRTRLRQVMAEKEACADLVTKTAQEQSSTGALEEKVQTTRKTFSAGPVTTTQVTTTKYSTQMSKKPISPFAKFKQLDKQNSLNSPSTPKTPSGSGPLFKFTDPALSQSASTIKERLLHWCKMKTKEYENIQLDNFSSSWADGLAFCALIHHFLPDAFDYHALTPKERRHNFTLAFKVADEKADIAPLLDVDDMVATRRPDWKCVFTYVQSIYRRFKDED